MHLKRHFPKFHEQRFHAHAANSIYAPKFYLCAKTDRPYDPCRDIACGLEFGQLSDYINATP